MKNLLAKVVVFFDTVRNIGRVRYKTIVYVRHARRRMKWRKISEEEVVRTLNNPDKIEALEENKYHAYKLMGPKNIRVTYRLSVDEVVVLTVVDKTD